MSVNPEKVEPVMSWERPKSVFEIHSFLGLIAYYKRFIEDFSRLPITRLTRKGVKFEWDDLCEKAFQELKRRLTSEKEAYFSSYSDILGTGIEVHVYYDASRDELGCVLM